MFHIRPVRPGDQTEWVQLRSLLWPDTPHEEHVRDTAAFLSGRPFPWSRRYIAAAVFVAQRTAGALCGFLEATIRPLANECETFPVGYIEGLFVDEDVRRQRIGRLLIRAAEEWTTSQGCEEIASDAAIDNDASLLTHRACGFAEVGRVVQFTKRLRVDAALFPSPPSLVRHAFDLVILPEMFAVCRLAPNDAVPAWATSGRHWSITRTSDELSIVCPEFAVPQTAPSGDLIAPHGERADAKQITPTNIHVERGWRCFRVAGSMPFELVGVLASIVNPLASAGISVFAISTFDSDYVLVKSTHLDRARAELEAAGHSVM